ncbi:MAG: acyltransferase [Hyphomonadaceae bacterium]|nr:acyltransferase [Hyphomonadaceae bacterium]
MSAADAKFRSDIQGLRAVAVLSVVLYHADAALLPGGFTGVDIFFVISGFLITGILLRELKDDRMSIAGFYHRRIKRLFPALFTLLAATLIAGALLMAPSDFEELARTALATVFFLSNFAFHDLSGYFDGAAADKPLLHTWSLAVEEQFYILYPLLLAFLWRRLRAQLGAIIVIGTVLAFALSVYGSLRHATAAFYLTPFRAFELSIGALLAIYPLRLAPALRHAASLLGLALMGAGFALIGHGTPFPGVAALAPCMGAALVIAAGGGGERSWGGALLSAPPMLFFGGISYSLYLWHWPALSFGRHFFMGELTAPQTALLLAIALAAATISWRFIEQPVLRASAKRGAVFVWGGAAMLVTSAVALGVMKLDGAPQRFSPQAQNLFAAVGDHNQRRRECHSNEDDPIPYSRNCVFGAEGAEPVAAIWGDSAGAELAVALGQILAERGQAVMEITSSACAPAVDYQLPERPTCAAHNHETLENVLRDDRLRVIILSVNFARYPAPERPRLFSEIETIVTRLRAAGKTVVLEYPAPNPWIEAPRVLGLMAARGQPLESAGLAYAAYIEENGPGIAFYDDLARRTGALPFKPAEVVCDGAFCPVYRPGIGVLYFNGNHLSISGARYALSAFPFDALPLPGGGAPNR